MTSVVFLRKIRRKIRIAGRSIVVEGVRLESEEGWIKSLIRVSCFKLSLLTKRREVKRNFTGTLRVICNSLCSYPAYTSTIYRRSFFCSLFLRSPTSEMSSLLFSFFIITFSKSHRSFIFSSYSRIKIIAQRH